MSGTNPITIRQVEGQEMLDILYRLDNYAFRATPPFPDRQEWEGRMATRKGALYYALFEGTEGVAITACPLFIQNVRGRLYPMAGFADVSAAPGARRKGYTRQLLRHAMHTLHAQGHVFSCLYPFRESFYERMGYVNISQNRKWFFSPASLQPLLKQDLGGEVRIVLSGEAYDEYLTYAHRMQTGVHGMAVFSEPQKEAAQANRNWSALARDASGELVGIMMYSMKGEEIMNFTMQATRFFYSSPRGRYLLLEWIARHIDQASKVELWLPAYEDIGSWLSDLRPKIEPVFVTPMGRVLDVSAMGGMSVGEGRFSARISDPDCPWNEGTWEFDGTGGVLTVRPTAQADCSLTIQGLSALVYGVNDPADLPWRAWGDPDEQVQANMRRMFSRQQPYLHEYY